MPWKIPKWYHRDRKCRKHNQLSPVQCQNSHRHPLNYNDVRIVPERNKEEAIQVQKGFDSVPEKRKSWVWHNYKAVIVPPWNDISWKVLADKFIGTIRLKIGLLYPWNLIKTTTRFTFFHPSVAIFNLRSLSCSLISSGSSSRIPKWTRSLWRKPFGLDASSTWC